MGRVGVGLSLRGQFKEHARLQARGVKLIEFINNKVNQIKMSALRRPELPQHLSSLTFSKTLSYSLSTEQSPRPVTRQSKQKSQLCKKFIEQGYCPYHHRCKFAHGLHELKKNMQMNSKYKTKECGGFIGEGFCPYGNRCNFIHPSMIKKEGKERFMEAEMVMIRCEGKQKSRLMALLKD